MHKRKMYAFVVVLVFVGTVFVTVSDTITKAEDGLMIAIDPDGNEHYVWQEVVESNYEIFYSNNIMDNETQTSSGSKSPVRLSNSSTDSVSPLIGIGPRTGLIFVKWIEKEISNDSHSYTVSRDRGETWIEPKEVHTRIRLKFANFDPIESTPSIPREFEQQKDPDCYILQFHTNIYNEWIFELEAFGISFLAYLPSNAFVVQLDEGHVSEVENLRFVRWLGPFHPAYKVATDLFDSEGMLDVSVLVYKEFENRLSDLQLEIVSLGGTIVREDVDDFIIEARIRSDLIAAIAHIPEVQWIERYCDSCYATFMNNVRDPQFTGAVTLDISGFQGTNILGGVMEWIGMFRHNDWTARVVNGNPPIPQDAHGSWVTGTVFGDGTGNANARGMMPNGNGVFYTSLNNQRAWVANDLANRGGVFLTHSWGSTQYTNQYTGAAVVEDNIVNNHDLTVTHAMANTGGLPTPHAIAKNIISVGALEHCDTPNRGDDHWAVNLCPLPSVAPNPASTGPAADGRVKPDLSGPYDMGFVTHTNQNYIANFGGTSFATPVVAGAGGLVREMYLANHFANNPGGSQPRASTVKAMLIANAFQYDLNTQATRMQQGWGGVDIEEVFDVGPNHFIVDEEISLRTDAHMTYYVTPVSPTDPMKISLVWTDPTAAPFANPALVNDLDLRVVDPTGHVYWGNWGLIQNHWSVVSHYHPADNVNNVENVFIQFPENGVWQIEVIGRNVPQDQDAMTPEIDQPFALVVSRGVAVDQANRISSDDGHYSQFADIAVDAENNQHIAWIDEREGSMDIYYSKLDDGGNVIVPETNIIGPSHVDQFSPVVVVGPDPLTQEEVVYVFFAYDGYNPVNDKYYARIGGKKLQNGDWIYILSPLYVYIGVGTPLADKSRIFDVAIDGSGHLHIVASYSYDSPEEETDAVEYYYSDDGGQTWDTSRPSIEYFVSDPRSEPHYRRFRYPNIDIGSGEILHVSFSFQSNPPSIGGYGGTSEIKASFSDDGYFWTTTEIGTSEGVARYNVLATDSSNYVYVAWHHYFWGDSFGILWSKNPFNGDPTSWTAQDELVHLENSDQMLPELVVDNKDVLNVVWVDCRNGNFEIYHRKSFDNGAHWTQDLRFTFEDDFSHVPSAAIGSNRILHIVWQDYRDSTYEIYHGYLLDEIRLTHENWHSITPKIVIDSDGNKYFVWRERVDGSDWEIMYEMLDSGGDNVLVQAQLTDDSDDDYSLAIAIDDSGPNVEISVVYVDEEPPIPPLLCGDRLFYARSTDGGNTWTHQRISWLCVDDDGAGGDIAVVPGGRIHVVFTNYVKYAGVETENLWYLWSDDDGQTWFFHELLQESYPSLGVPHFGMINYPNVAVHPPYYVHVTFAYDPDPAPLSDPSQTGPQTSIEYFRSLNGGGTSWVREPPIVTTNEIGRYHSLVADHDGCVHLAWHDRDILAGIPYSVFYATNWLNGDPGFWETGALADDPTRDQHTPDLAVDTAGDIYAAWSEDKNGVLEIYHSICTHWDWDLAWDVPKRLTISSGDSYNLSIFVDTDGVLHLTWQDMRGAYAQIYYRNL